MVDLLDKLAAASVGEFQGTGTDFGDQGGTIRSASYNHFGHMGRTWQNQAFGQLTIQGNQAISGGIQLLSGLLGIGRPNNRWGYQQPPSARQDQAVTTRFVTDYRKSADEALRAAVKTGTTDPEAAAKAQRTILFLQYQLLRGRMSPEQFFQEGERVLESVGVSGQKEELLKGLDRGSSFRRPVPLPRTIQPRNSEWGR